MRSQHDAELSGFAGSSAYKFAPIVPATDAAAEVFRKSRRFIPNLQGVAVTCCIMARRDCDEQCGRKLGGRIVLLEGEPEWRKPPGGIATCFQMMLNIASAEFLECEVMDAARCFDTRGLTPHRLALGDRLPTLRGYRKKFQRQLTCVLVNYRFSWWSIQWQTISRQST